MLHAGGFPQRALVITGPDGVVRWSYQAASPGELPAVELLREGLAGAGTPRRLAAAEPARRCPLSSVRSDTRKKKRTADRRAEQEGSEYE